VNNKHRPRWNVGCIRIMYKVICGCNYIVFVIVNLVKAYFGKFVSDVIPLNTSLKFGTLRRWIK